MNTENMVLDLSPITNTFRIGKVNKKGNELLWYKEIHNQFLRLSAIYFSKAKKSKVRAKGKDYMIFACEDSVEKLEGIKKEIEARIKKLNK